MDDVYCTSFPTFIFPSVFLTMVTLSGNIVPTTVVIKLSPYEFLGIPTVDIGAPLLSVPIVTSVVIELPLPMISIIDCMLLKILLVNDDDTAAVAATWVRFVTLIGLYRFQLKLSELLPIAPKIESVPCLITSSIIPYDWDTNLTSVSVPDTDDLIESNTVTLILPSVFNIIWGVSKILDWIISLEIPFIYLTASNVSVNWVVLAIDGNKK